MTHRWVPSRYTRSIRLSGGGRMLYNAYSGAIAAIDPDESAEVGSLLESGSKSDIGSALAAELREAGFLVSAGTDELIRVHKLHEALQEAKSLHLVIMPTEACNFRCTYCYQTFPRGEMTRETIRGLKAYVREAVRGIDHLAVSWFGGEPLLALDTIRELSDSFLDSCLEAGVVYSADMSTNGYFLTRERFTELLDRNVRRFMVTLDGTGEVHDSRRKLHGTLDGFGQTYERIIDNLLGLRQLDDHYAIDLRVNFDDDNAEEVPELLDKLSEWFAGDDRFQLMVRPVSRLGGQNDARIPACDRSAADTNLWKLTEYGLDQGLALSESIVDTLMPSGAVCYAARPNSLIVGANGQLYKCSVAFDEEANQVGRIYEDGTLELDMEKMALWTGSGEEKDEVCQACFFRPACQGNYCPLYRMRTGKRPCSHEKRKIKQVLNLIWKNTQRSKGGERK